MKLSIVDLSPVPPGAGPTEAFSDTVDLARRAEALGYSRFWVAEHHGRSTGAAGSNPEVLIARVAAKTERIRVGSGTVLLNHYSPFKVAEVFQVLHAMSPGRIDLGIGRANGRPVVDYALQRDRDAFRVPDDYDEQVVELMSWLDRRFPPDHPFAEVRLHPNLEGNPEPWILGSSPASAALAGALGLRYCFAGFINPAGAAAAAAAYREHFRPSPFPSGVQAPYTAVAMNVSCGETDRDGDRLRATVELFYRRLRSGSRANARRETPEVAIKELGGVPAPSVVRPGAWQQHISGGPERVRAMLETMAADFDAEEVVIQDMIALRDDRLRSFELLAQAFDLVPRASQDTSLAADGG